MKIKLLAFIIMLAVCFTACKKLHFDTNGLPAATQEGKNTLGFRLNGQAWTPKGVRGTANLSIDYDPNFNNGIFDITAYDFSSPQAEQFTIGIRDSLNFINAPQIYTITQTSLCGISFTNNCDYFSRLSGSFCSGNLTITKLDRLNHIISGTFSATLYKPGCDTIKITDGRFDMRF